MFLDEAKINIKAGNGGDGMVTYFNLRGGKKKIPCGGKGGKGGNIVIQATSGLSTLQTFKKKIHYKAENGIGGQPNNRNGKDGKDLMIKVPVGTMITDGGGNMTADLAEDGDRVLIAAGGIGGRGNSSFTSQARRFPGFAEKGEETGESWISLELRLVADVALVGFPNSGKSTIISRISAARPKIADYPFTTLTPNLGVVTIEDEDFTVADIPGLVEGAHKGVGLGDKFLRHITRAAILAIVLDGQKILEQEEDSGIIKTFDVLREEIRLYNNGVYKKDYIVVVNKIDLIPDKSITDKIRKELRKRSRKKVFLVSAITGTGLDDMIWSLYQRVKAYREELAKSRDRKMEKSRVRVYAVADENKINIQKADGNYIVKNKKLERMVAMTDLENEEALEYLKHRLKKMGTGDRLKKMGIEEGATIIIGNLVFDLME